MMLLELGLTDVRVNATSCLGPCEHGSNLVIYPEGTFYRGVRPSNVRELLESHFVLGKKYAPLLVP
jgi:sirohydrochlorin cobaltochelatase